MHSFSFASSVAQVAAVIPQVPVMSASSAGIPNVVPMISADTISSTSLNIISDKLSGRVISAPRWFKLVFTWDSKISRAKYFEKGDMGGLPSVLKKEAPQQWQTGEDGWQQELTRQGGLLVLFCLICSTSCCCNTQSSHDFTGTDQQPNEKRIMGLISFIKCITWYNWIDSICQFYNLIQRIKGAYLSIHQKKLLHTNRVSKMNESITWYNNQQERKMQWKGGNTW